MRDHERWLAKLSEYVDGSLPPGEARAMDGHLAGCAECRRVRAELQDVVARARELGPMEPEHDLWPAIAEGIARRGRASLPAARRGRLPRALFLTLPQLAAAAAVLAFLSGATAWWLGPGAGARGRGEPPHDSEARAAAAPGPGAASVLDPAPDLAREIASLKAVLEDARALLDPHTVRLLDKNLHVIERAIAESRRALEMDPGNAYLRQHLERAYRGKADFLREVALIAAWEG